MLRKFALIVAVLFLAAQSFAQESAGTPAAKAEYDKARAAYTKGDYQAALDGYRKAIDIDPHYAAAYEQYVRIWSTLPALLAVGNRGGSQDTPETREKTKAAQEQTIRDLEERAKKDPTNAVAEWALSRAYSDYDRRKSDEHCLRALRLDPKFGRALSQMAASAEMLGDVKLMREYQRKAAEASPDDPSPAFVYTTGAREQDVAEFLRLGEAFLKRFPAAPNAAPLLGMLAEDADTPAHRIAILERLRREYPKATVNQYYMRLLVNEYGKSDPAKAVAFARELAKEDERAWGPVAEREQNLLEASRLIADGKAAEAAVLLEKMQAETWVSDDRLERLKAAALDGQQKTQAAYDGLANVVMANPTDETLAALLKYGTKLRKTAADVNADVGKLRAAAAKPIEDFSLEGFGPNEGKKLSLAQFKGKVVLLTFWYPG